MRPATAFPVRRFERIDSTNAEARRLADSGEREPLWIAAEEQTAGRGRLGRSWVSEPGNLYATLLLPLAADIAVASQLSFVAAVAVHDVVSGLAPGAMVRIKWPNDVLIGGAKVCGLLSEVICTAPAIVAIGCGLNVAHAPAGTPYPVTALARHGFAGGAEEVFAMLDARLGARIGEWSQGRGFGHIRAAWNERALGLGGAVAVSNGGLDAAGRFAGIGEDGALMVETETGERIAVHAGDVRFAELERLRQVRS